MTKSMKIFLAIITTAAVIAMASSLGFVLHRAKQDASGIIISAGVVQHSGNCTLIEQCGEAPVVNETNPLAPQNDGVDIIDPVYPNDPVSVTPPIEYWTAGTPIGTVPTAPTITSPGNPPLPAPKGPITPDFIRGVCYAAETSKQVADVPHPPNTELMIAVYIGDKTYNCEVEK